MPDQSTIVIILLTVSVIDLAFGIVIFLMGRKDPLHQLFSLWMLSIAGWTLAIVGYFVTSTELMALMWLRASYSTALFVVMSFWYLTTLFPGKERLSAPINLLNMLSLLFFSQFIMLTGLVVSDVSTSPDRWLVNLSTAGWVIYSVYLLFFFVAAHVLLVKEQLATVIMKKSALARSVLGLFVLGAVAIVFASIVLPSPAYMDWDFIWMGPTVMTLVMVPVVAYAVSRKKLDSVHGSVTKIIVIFLILFSFSDAIFFHTGSELILRLFIAIVIFFVGVSFLKSLRTEAKEKKSLEETFRELNFANINLKQSDDMKDEFLSIASHELRTPVSVVKGYLSLMLEGAYGKVSDEVRLKLEEIFQMNERLIRIINNLLSTSAIDKKRLTFDLTELYPEELMDSVVKDMGHHAGEKQILLSYKKSKRKVPKVYADKDKTLQVLSNLVDNAIKYSSEKSWIELSVQKDDSDTVKFSVKDAGIGVSDAEKKHIFKRFYRISNEEMRKENGTGLGLYICKAFVEGMGGEIVLEESVEGKGSTFAFTLPTVKASS